MRRISLGNSKYQLLEDLNEEEFKLLEQDILRRGIQVAIEFDDKKNVLDGHNRLKIAEKHGLEYPWEVRKFKTEEEKKIHVLMLNMARRHMKPHQWGGCFKQLLKLQGARRGKGGDRKSTATVAVDLVSKAAEDLGVSDRTARHRMEQHDVYETLPKEEKKAIDAGEKSMTSTTRKKKQEKKREEAATTAKLTGKFSVILADPPWEYGATTQTGSAGQHYATMKTSEICEMSVADHTTENAVLFLWVTNPMVPDGLQVVRAWGFSYKTNIVWVKDKATTGLGNYLRGKHELLFIATRGSFVPEKAKRPESVIVAPREEHSRKPGKVFGLIEKLYPGQKYLELFSRSKRNGWKCWGSEIKGR
jgi:N6-adenosine-specific RNA methylase IME4/ParB-like chromosome segregation protein Spo0J